MAKNTRNELEALRQQTSDASSPDAMRATPAYKALLKQGTIGPLLEAIDLVPVPIMMLLGEISGEDPVPREARGYISLMVDAWKKWGDMRSTGRGRRNSVQTRGR